MLTRCLVFNDTASTEIYTLALHDALPILRPDGSTGRRTVFASIAGPDGVTVDCAGNVYWVSNGQGRVYVFSPTGDRKSTRLNSSHANISYAVFCLKKNTTPYILTSLFQFY